MSREGFNIKRYPDWVQKAWPSLLKYMMTVALPAEGGMVGVLKDVQSDIYNGNGYSTQIYATVFLDWARVHHPAEYRIATGLTGERSYVVDLSKPTTTNTTTPPLRRSARIMPPPRTTQQGHNH
jgi:hypothetical protein